MRAPQKCDAAKRRRVRDRRQWRGEGALRSGRRRRKRLSALPRTRSALVDFFSLRRMCACLGEAQPIHLYQDKHTSCIHSLYTGLILVDGLYTITVR